MFSVCVTKIESPPQTKPLHFGRFSFLLRSLNFNKFHRLLIAKILSNRPMCSTFIVPMKQIYYKLKRKLITCWTFGDCVNCCELNIWNVPYKLNWLCVPHKIDQFQYFQIYSFIIECSRRNSIVIVFVIV